MSAYGRAPNVSQYIANLNSLPAGQEAGSQAGQAQRNGPAGQQEIGNLDEEIAYFSQAELFDFELTANGAEQLSYPAANNKNVKPDDDSAMGFHSNFSTFFDSGAHQPLQLNTEFASTANFDPQLFHSPASTTFPQSAGPQRQQQQQQPPSQQEAQTTGAVPQDHPSPASSVENAGQVAGTKRAHSESSPAGSVEDAARMAAEEDKRRRNTAASARFRIKKKQREAALEKTAKDMTDKVDMLQKRVSELEMENKWLRGLVVEKGLSVKKEGDEEVTDAGDNRIPDKQAKIGVGTKPESA